MTAVDMLRPTTQREERVMEKFEERRLQTQLDLIDEQIEKLRMARQNVEQELAALQTKPKQPSSGKLEILPLAAWRQLLGWSVRTLGDQANASKNAITEIENKRRSVHPATMRKLADALGVRVDQVAEFRAMMGLPAKEGEE